jgi:prepilin-type N-terminal cleavage/methylation domain-containing protein
MQKIKGFTLIELLIVVAIIGIGVAVLFPLIFKGELGVTCNAGYKFTSGEYGVQIFDEQGHAIPCETNSSLSFK